MEGKGKEMKRRQERNGKGKQLEVEREDMSSNEKIQDADAMPIQLKK